jgi:AraC-like DNA-binding protein
MPHRRCIHSLFVCLALTASFGTGYAQRALDTPFDISRLEHITRMQGKLDPKQGVARLSKPRKVVTVRIAQWRVPPFMGLGSLAAFSRVRSLGAPFRMPAASRVQHLADAVAVPRLSHGTYELLSTGARHDASDEYSELLATIQGYIRRDATHVYVVERRIDEACRRLRSHRHESIADVALSLGFSSQSHFTEAFRRRTGSTPRAWRTR